MQLPGLTLLNVMTVLAAIGNISRFPTDKQLVSYGGLAPGAHDSGESHQDGHLSKQGCRDLRRVLIEATWSAVNTHPYWKREFARLCRHKPEGVAIARSQRYPYGSNGMTERRPCPSKRAVDTSYGNSGRKIGNTNSVTARTTRASGAPTSAEIVSAK